MRLLARKRRLRLFYASDIHGSEKCFLKFINAARFYGIDVLVLGGDLTGKVVIPLVRQGAGRYVAQFQGEAHLIDGDRSRRLLARFVFHLPARALYAAVVLAALPTAQNIYNFASRYERGEAMARDAVLVTTALSALSVAVIAVLLVRP